METIFGETFEKDAEKVFISSQRDAERSMKAKVNVPTNSPSEIESEKIMSCEAEKKPPDESSQPAV